MKFNVEKFYLKKSVLTKEKPVYETLEEFTLKI
jgi:2'-5' RNA ligase